MSVMYIRNEQTGEFEPVPSLVGPQGPPGDNGGGAGTVTSVNKVAPDATGNVTLTAAEVGAADKAQTEQALTSLSEEKADKEGEYELIETINVNESISEIERYLEPDGTPYCFKKIHVVIDSAPSTGNSGIINCWFDRDPEGFLLTISGAVETVKKYSQMVAYIENGVATGFAVVAGLSPSEIMNAYMPARVRLNKFMDAFRYMRMVASVPIQAGSTIAIWGVRANV